MMALFALMVVLLAWQPATAQPGAPRAATSPSPSPVSPDALFSRRALRRARLLIQMRLEQLRDERLECVRQALLRQLPGALWPEEPSPTRGSSTAAAAAERCAELLRF
jgi:hypothetical protein